MPWTRSGLLELEIAQVWSGIRRADCDYEATKGAQLIMSCCLYYWCARLAGMKAAHLNGFVILAPGAIEKHGIIMRRRYIYDKRTGTVVPYEQRTSSRSHEIMTDLAEPFVSPVDGTLITSREQRRQHNARNQCEDVGNDPAFRNPVPPGQRPEALWENKRARLEAIRRAVQDPQAGPGEVATGNVRILRIMPFDGSGNFTRTDGGRTGANAWEQARDANRDVLAADHDTHDEDLATGLELAVLRDGQNTPSMDLPMGGYKHTGVADATGNSEYAAFGQVTALILPFVSAADVGGTANAITVAPTPAVTSLAAGTGVRFFVETANTGAVTLAVSGLAGVAMLHSDGYGDGCRFVGGRRLRRRGLQRLSVPDERTVAGLTYRNRAAPWARANNPSGTIPDNRVPSSIARDSEIPTNSEIDGRIAAWARQNSPSGQAPANRIALVLTQAAYDALTPVANTLYLISG